MPKVSVIIPFNNVEQYIGKCLESVTGQTLKDIEIICVNDASDDKSRKIAEKYAKKDDRIKIIDVKTRQGQGFARNRAIEIAKGEYIGFVDSDDWIEPDMFEQLYAKAKENDNEIVICQATEYDDINEKFITSDYYSLSILEKMGDKVFSAEDIKKDLLDVNVVLWNKIYKSSYLQKTGAKFPEGFIYEDLPFFFETILPAKKIQIVWKNLYIYRINRKNSTMRQSNNKILDRLDMVYLTYEILKKCTFLQDEINKIKGWIINDLFHRYILLKENYHKEYFFRMKKIFENLDIKDINEPFWKTIYHFEGYLMVLNNDFEGFNQKLFTKYLDIHEIENRLRIEISNSEVIDKKLSLIYDEITKNYEYTNKQKDDLKTEIIAKSEEILSETNEKINAQSDKQGKEISKIYEEISKNYEYTNKQKDDLKTEIFSETGKILSETDNKISHVYDEITKNYEYTNKLVQEAKDRTENTKNEIQETWSNINNLKSQIFQNEEKTKEIKDNLSKEMQDKFDYSNALTDDKVSKMHFDINQKISGLYDKNAQNYESLTGLIENSVSNLEQKINQDSEQKINVINEKISSNDNEIRKFLEKNTEDILLKMQLQKEQEKEFFEKEKAELKKYFEDILKIQKSDYETQIKYLKEKIKELEKSPLKKFVEKLNKKNK